MTEATRPVAAPLSAPSCPASYDRVAVFASCLANQFFAGACTDSVALLRRFGFRVSVPKAQSCCGQPAHSGGYVTEARRIARRNLRVFEPYDWVVLPSGSCASMLRHGYQELLGSESDHVTRKTFELAEFLAAYLGPDTLRPNSLGNGLTGQRVAYHHGCHALRELGVDDQPLALLRACGAEVVEWEAARECCGFGGAFSIRFPEVSGAMADRKLDTLPPIDLLTSADPGCLLQLGGRLSRRGLKVKVEHLASLLRLGGEKGRARPVAPVAQDHLA